MSEKASNNNSNKLSLTVEELFGVFPDLVFVLNDEYVIQEFKAGNRKDLYLAPENFLGKSMCDVLPIEATTKLREACDLAYKTKEFQQTEYRLIIQDTMKWFEARVSLTSNNRLITLVRDITESKCKEEQILYQATHDHLTGLYNRAFAFDYISQKLKEAARTHSITAILFVDLDNFKLINDSYGHDKGDQVLVVTANAIKNTLREQDLVARVGGDEFIVALDGDLQISDIKDIAQKVIHNLKAEIAKMNLKSNVTASIGVSICSKGNTGVSELIRQADAAMYKSKKLGKDDISFSVPN
jgi:diguanylate cyclase (GGDEF)-like protein